jgi:hypothetical protein
MERVARVVLTAAVAAQQAASAAGFIDRTGRRTNRPPSSGGWPAGPGVSPRE